MSQISNDRIIIENIISQRKEEIGDDISESEFFEIYTAEQILKDYDLSYDEIISGIVGGGNDGGIDSIYTLINGEIVIEDTDLSVYKKEVSFDLVFIQSKNSSGFSEDSINKFIAVCGDLLNLSADLLKLNSVYNPELLEKAELFRNAYTQLAGRFPKLRVHFFYATKGESPHGNVVRKVASLERKVKDLFSDAVVVFNFVGAKELLSLARKQPVTAFDLQLSEAPISSIGEIGFICLVKLKDYYEFITDQDKSIRRGIFEANVRDYQGNVQVNSDIQSTLKGDRKVDFWWLNNGVTIVASNATLSSKKITIESPNVVNGLQTSTEIFNYYTDSNTEGDERSLQVKIVVPEEGLVRDRIIKATNFQTTIPGASLRATDKIHRDIEDYLKTFSLFYDRRKNFYKNEGKPIDKIVSIGQLAQAVMSVLLHQSDDARARPSSLIKDDTNYERVFNAGYPLSLYRVCAEILKGSEKFLKRPELGLSRRDRNNLRFYLSMHAGMRAVGQVKVDVKSISEIDIDTIDDAFLMDSLSVVQAAYEKLGGTDQVAKGKELIGVLIDGFPEKA